MRPNSKHFFGSLRIAAAALFALVVSSCQTEPAKPVETGTYSVSIPPINEEYRTPDLVTWRIGSDTGSAAVAGGGSSFQIQLQAKVEGDVWFDLWRSGVRIMQLKYVRKTETTLEYASEKREDSLAREIFRQILPSKDSSAFAKKLAEQVVSKDSVNRSTEQAIALMVGVNRDTLVAEALRIMAQSGQSIDKFLPQGRDSFLGLSIESIHVQVKVLVELKVIVTDTNALFPPPPVRVVSNLAMPEKLQAGGDAAGVTGKFEATGKIATLIAKVYQDTLDVSRHFEIPQVDLTSRPRELELNGKLSVTAKASAAAGTYRLEVVVMDADETPNSIKAVVGFQVLPAADTVGPIIQILSPTVGTVLENDVSTVAVKAQIEDPSGVDSVWISDKLAVGVDGIWSATSVEIPVTDIGFAVVVRATDGQGNISSKDVLVGRKAKLDPGAPSWTVLSPKANEVFAFDSSSVAVRWKVSDPRAEISKAWIGGGEASKDADGIWIRRVELPATGALTTVTLVAVNAKGDSVQGFVQVTRQADTKGPAIQIKSPLDGSVLGYEVQAVMIKIAATDPSGVDSVKVNGKLAESVSTEYVHNLALEPGKDVVIRVEAWDKFKNRFADSVKISRKGPPDTTAPKLKLLSPASGTELSIETRTAKLRWLVTDLFGIVDTSVKIDGKTAQRSSDTFSLEVAVPAPGREETHRIDVQNVKGVSNFETMSLKRVKDATAPKLARVDSGRTVPFETEKATVSWKVTDNYRLGAVTISGKIVTGADGLYSQEVALATGDNRIAILATDSVGNPASDTVVMHRTWKDTSKPLVVRQSGTEPNNVPFATTEFTASWKVTDNALSTVTINGAVITSADGIYILKVTLAGAQTPIKIVAKDAAGNSKVDSITITKSDDLTDPVVARLPGTKDTTVPYATSTYALGWEVIDESGVGSVTVNGMPATKSGDNYRLTVSLLKVGLNEFLMVAKDVAGNESYDTIRIRRAYHDSIAPKMARGATTKDLTVPYGTANYTLSWTVTDNDKVKSVTIGGGVTSVTGDVYSRSMDLVTGPNKFGMLATDTAGNTVTDTVTITVAADGAAPVITRDAGTQNDTVAYGVTSVTLKWTITDDVGVTSVTVNGVAVEATTSSAYSYTLASLKFGTNGAKVVAKDAAGKTSADTLTITRKSDVSAPSIVRQSGTKDSAVAYEKTTHSLSWKVTDDNGLASVKVNGTTVQSSSGTYTFPISGLVIGANGFKIVATDVAGKISSDSVTITRAWKDTIAPVVTRQTGTGPQTVLNGTTTLNLAWKVTDTLLQTVTIQGVLKTGASNIYSTSISLVVGSNKISLVAIDKQGNVTKDEFVVVRGAPAPIHSAVSGKYIGTVYDTLTSLGSDSIQVSIDGVNWEKASDVAKIRTNGAITFFAKAWPGGATSSISLNIKQIKAVSAGSDISYFLTENGDLWATGYNGFGGLGQGTIGEATNVSSPVFVTTGVSRISASPMGKHIFILKSNGDVYGLGFNGRGQLGTGNTATQSYPIRIATGVSDISAGDDASFFLKKDSLWAMGANYSGLFGLGVDTPSSDSLPYFVGTGYLAVSAGAYHTLFLKNDGGLWATGNNYNGECTGDTYQQIAKKFIANSVTLTQGAPNRSYFITKANTLWGVGDNYYNQLGTGTPTSAQQTPIIMGENVKMVAGGSYLTMFVNSKSELMVSGVVVVQNDFRGTGKVTFSTPAKIMDDVNLIASGKLHHVVVRNDGTLWAFGSNAAGQLGNGQSGMDAGSPDPIQISF